MCITDVDEDTFRKSGDNDALYQPASINIPTHTVSFSYVIVDYLHPIV